MGSINKKIKYLIFIFLFLFFAFPLNAEAKNHTYSLSAFDYDPINETGTGDEIVPSTDFIEPGQVIGINIDYEVGDVPVTGMQIGINYDPNMFEALTDGGDVYFDFDESSINAGGIWPPAGTSNKLKNKTNWSADASDIEHQTDSSLRQIRILLSDSKQSDPLEEDGTVVTVYFIVKEAATAGSVLSIDLDSDYTRAANGSDKQPVSVNNIELIVFGEKNDDVTLSDLTLTGSNGKTYETNPKFVAGTASRTFNVIVPNKVTTLNFAATPTDSLAKILSGGLGDKSLQVGDNSFTLTVQSQHGTQELYTINVKRLSANTSLKTLDLSGVTLDYELTDGIYTYTATVPFATKKTTVSATAKDNNASISGTGEFKFDKYGNEKNIKNIVVSAEDCKSEYSSVVDNDCTSQNYKLEVTRIAPSSNNLLSDIKVDGVSIDGFTSSTNTYTLQNQANSKKSISITATASDSLSQIEGIGNKSLAIGDNSFDIVVTAEDGSKNTYTLNVRRLNNNANLGSLVLTPTGGTGSLTPNFSGNFYNYYTYTYDPNVTSIAISGTTEVPTASITSGIGNYSSGETEANVVVTAEDGTIATYVIKFSRQKSSDNTLSSLSIDGYTFNEAFSPTKTLYSVTVPGTVGSVNVNATANDSNAKIVSGTGSHSLNYGTNNVQVRVTAENGTSKDYTITITRSKKTIATLSDLKVDAVSVSDFAENVLTYDIGTVPFTKTSINISATTKDSDATVTGVGTVNLSTGDNTFDIIVTAHDGVTKTTYQIKVEREKSSDTTLKSLTLKEKTFTFDKDTHTYNLDVPYEVSTATISAVTNYVDASYSVSGPSSMTVGVNTYTVSVTAENGEIDTYILNINRKPSTNNYLKSLIATHSGTNYLNNFDKTKEVYTFTVPNEVSNIDIGATLEDSLNSTVTGLGVKELETGLNIFTVEVTAASNDKKTYTLNITRDLNGNNKLSGLEVVGHSLNPSFNKDVTSYSLTVESNVDSVVISATPEEEKSTVTGTGIKTLQTGTNTFNIVVEAENHAKLTYVVVVTKKASSDNLLKSLSIDETILNEPFQPEVTSYTASVGNSVDKIHINALANDEKAKSVTGAGTVNLSTGNNPISIVVTAEDNTTKTYTIIVNRAKNTNADLKSLGLNGGHTLSPEFDKDVTSYTVNVPFETSSLLISAEKEVQTSTVTGTGLVNLTTGHNIINVVVTAEDTNVKKTYTLDIFRTLSSDANLKKLESKDGVITPAFDKDVTSYSLTVPYEIENAEITATPAYEAATVKIDNNDNLKVGNNDASITVTAEDGTLKIYNITIIRQPSSNNFLSNLSVIDKNSKNYIEVFNKSTLSYNITVANDIDKVTINAVAEDTEATIKGTGEKELETGLNTFTVESISANGTPRNYILKITRSKNSNTRLSSLSVENQVLIPDFSPEVFSYSLNVDSTVSKVTINAEAEEQTSKVSGTGEKELTTGLNTFSVEVEAEDKTKKAYVISINKIASDNNYLSSLLSDKPMNETFNKNTTDYTVNVENNITQINIQAVAESEIATVTGTGVHQLKVGDNIINVVVTAEDNTTRTYKITVNREASSNNNLSDLKVNNSKVPGFDKDKLNYELTVENEITEANIAAELEDSTASVSGTGKVYLVTTDKNTINVTVTAENGDVKIYTIEITRKKSSNNNLYILSSLEGSLSPTFDKNTINYTMSVPYEVTSLTLTTVAEDANAVVGIEGNVDFQIGNNNYVYIPVTAEDESTKTYQIQVTRQPQANNFLSSLSVVSSTGKTFDLNPNFNKNILNYSISIDENDTNLTISGTRESTSSTVTGLENINISSFPYNHEIVVTSAGGIDRKYIITINRTKSSNAKLKNITINKGSLNPEFDPDTTEYNVNVGSDVDSIDISATLDKGQTIAGTGTHNLTTGNNEINLTVTAEDGTLKIYKVNVYKTNEVLPALSDIQIDKGSLEPSFSSDNVNYVLQIDESETEVNITPIKADPSLNLSIALNSDTYEDISTIRVDDLSKGNVVKIKVSGVTKTRTYSISILNSSSTNEKITSNTYGHVISNEMIKTVRINTTSEELKNQLDNDNSKLKIYKSDGKTECTNEKLGTGMIVKLIVNDIVLDQKIIVIKGDTDGNGLIDAIDALKVVNHIIGNEQLLSHYLIAADTSNDDNIDAIDALKIVNHIIGNGLLY